MPRALWLERLENVVNRYTRCIKTGQPAWCVSEWVSGQVRAAKEASRKGRKGRSPANRKSEVRERPRI
jgi:hypothetical protein